MGQIQATINICDVCGHRWLSDGTPKRCSKCKSAKWDTREIAYEVGADRAKPGTDLSVDGIIPIRREYQTVEEASKEFPNSMSPDAKAKREQIKTDRAKRKAELRKSVAQAVKNPPSRATRFAGRTHIEPEQFAAQVEQKKIDCIHPSNQRVGSRTNWRCLLCGFKKQG